MASASRRPMPPASATERPARRLEGGDSVPRLLFAWVAFFWLTPLSTPAQDTRPVVLKPARVFDGVTPVPHNGWVVLVRGERIDGAGPEGQVKVPADARVIELSGTTLLPGLIDAHTHVLLHPYNE